MLEVLFCIIIVFISVVLHEVAHGWLAKKNGDKTAEYAGRLTLNPQKHIDFFGTILLPAFLYFSNLPIFGYAKPVPVNEYNIKNKRGMLMVASAGIIVNAILAVLFFVLLKMSFNFELSSSQILYNVLFFGFNINIMLVVFNLIPVPPFDGYKIIQELEWIRKNNNLESNLILQILFLILAIHLFHTIFPYIQAMLVLGLR